MKINETIENLRRKYGNEIMPQNIVRNTINNLIEDGIVCKETICNPVPMRVGELEAYIKKLHSEYGYRDSKLLESCYLQEDVPEKDTFYTSTSFIDNLKAKTESILVGNKKENKVKDVFELRNKKQNILNGLLKSLLEFEKKDVKSNNIAVFLFLGCVTLSVLFLIMFMIQTEPV